MHKTAFFLGTFLFSGLTFSSSPYLAIYGGGQSNSTSLSDFYLIGNQQEVLINDKHTNPFMWGVGAGLQWNTSSNNKLSKLFHDFSLEIDYLAYRQRHTGDVLDYGELNNFNYYYKVKSDQIMLNFRPALPSLVNTIQPSLIDTLQPFLVFGIGVTINSTYYKQSPKNLSAGQTYLTMPSQSLTMLAFDVGGGITMAINDKLKLFLQYLYTDAGKAKTGTYANLMLMSPVRISVKTQSYLVGISYTV